jgi:alkylhydroperoxidase family enzyme
MPRLRQIPRSEAAPSVLKHYDRLFGERDPVKNPGTATGTPGNWWTTFALVPPIFEHATAQFGMFGMFSDKTVSKLDPKLREIAILRTGYVVGSRFVYSQHCKAGRRVGLTEEQIASIAQWSLAEAYSPVQRAALAYTDCLILERGRVPDALFETLRTQLSDEDILELTYHVLSYNLHATCCKALRLEYDDVPERISEVPVPKDGQLASDWAGQAWDTQRPR